MLCSLSVVSGLQRPIVSKKHSVSCRGSKMIMKSSKKCPDSTSKSLEDIYVETMKKLYQPPIGNIEDVYDEAIKRISQPIVEPIVEELTIIDEKITETRDLLRDIDRKLGDVIITLDKLGKMNKYPYDDIYVDGIRETNDVY